MPGNGFSLLLESSGVKTMKKDGLSRNLQGYKNTCIIDHPVYLMLSALMRFEK
jgi:hypothetical protein